jgi:TolB-like protein/Tfp pilus assembly protein PilF
MASLIPGYTYDIFISYRQKDNKGDKWVSEFVDALKTELESTFKEEISVYFDINLHDGLLETHDVDASLKEKLKCLVFIPIISQTYCDSKSFAWQHEFCAFNKLAKEDQFGRDIRLAGGNVASRILPIKIHDLDPDDKRLLEHELVGLLRSIEFIYKSAGVNRPLRANEDHPQDNLNKTYYRDQINKVANAVKEIVSALKKQNQLEGNVSKEVAEPNPEKHQKLITKIIITSAIILTLIVSGYFIIPKLFISSEPFEKSIAVLPFVNLSNDPEQEYFSDGMVDAILDHLFKVGELKVISRTSSMIYKDSKLPLKTIAHELGVSSILEGSWQKIGNNVRITAQLIDTKTDTHLWSETYDRNLSDIFIIQSEVAKNVARELKATITIKEKGQIEKPQTESLEAYNLYLQGRFFWSKRTKEGLEKSVEYFRKSIAEDPNYALAYAGLADAYHIQAWWGWTPRLEGFVKSKEFVLKALDIDKDLAEAHATLGSLLLWSDWDWDGARNELNLAIRLNPGYANAYQYYSELFEITGPKNDAREKINTAISLDPLSSVMHFLSGRYYYDEGKYDESLNEFSKVLEINPDYKSVYPMRFYIYLMQREDLKAVEAFQKMMLNDTSTFKYSNIVKEIFSKSGINGILNFMIALQLKNPEPWTLSIYFALSNNREEALNWLGKAVEEHTPNVPRINSEPIFDNLRSEPRVQALIKKMGLSEYQKTD